MLKVILCALFLNSFLISASENVNIIPHPKKIVENNNEILFKTEKQNAIIALSSKNPQEENYISKFINDQIYSDYAFKIPAMDFNKLTEEQVKNDFIIVFGMPGDPVFDKISPEFNEIFKKNLSKIDSSQAYSLIIKQINGIKAAALAGKTKTGILYAAATFVQTIKRNDKIYSCPEIEITDYPDFNFRWAYKASLDDAAKYKINMAPYIWIYDKFKPDTNKYLQLNRKAAQMGIKPVTALWGSLNEKNRKSYPEGEIYRCIGTSSKTVNEEGFFQTFSDESSVQGYCMSNPELLNLKAEKIKKFVENNEPLCLYIHYHDNDVYSRATMEWKNRCPKCREQYPSDTLEDENGKTKAVANELNALIEAIQSVKKENGYNASKDCSILFVIAPYTRWSEYDSTFDKEIKFYVNISKNLKQTENIHFVIREQFYDNENKSRMKKFAEALKKNGKGHTIFSYYHGGDSRTTSRKWPQRHSVNFRWLASPLLMPSAMESSIGGLAQINTSPQLMAEFFWNKKPLAIDYSQPKNKKEMANAYCSLISGMLPVSIFGTGKYFDKTQKNRYGNEAGAIIADGIRPEQTTLNGEKKSLIFPETNEKFLNSIDKVWDCHDSLDIHKAWKILFEKMSIKNRKAIKAIGKALLCKDLKQGRKVELLKLKEKYGNALSWIAYCKDKADFYISLHDLSQEKAKQKYQILKETLNNFPKKSKAIAAKQMKSIDSAYGKFKEIKNRKETQKKESKDQLAQASKIKNEIKTELAAKENYDVNEKKKLLEPMRIGLFKTKHLDEKLWKLDIKNIEKIKSIDDDIMGYDILIFMGKEKISADECDLLQSFVSSGRGLMILGSAPYYMCASTNLENISQLLGAKSYGNAKGKISAPWKSFITQDSENWLRNYPTQKQLSALSGLTTAVPLIVYKKDPGFSFMCANKYKGGRILHSSAPELPDAMMLKALLWLAYNKNKI